MSPPRYSPDHFPPVSFDWKGLLPRIVRAHRVLARYEGVLAGVPNPDLLLAPLAGQEAVLSSRIEGTRSSLGDILALDANEGRGSEADPSVADAREVLNYQIALAEAVALLEELPLSQRLLRQVHGTLMQGVRGGAAGPGEYRRVQNWIGSPGSTAETATFLPCPAPDIPAAMGVWERYLHSQATDPLVQLAVLHVWFEAIHPFLDGNGRLGRLMFPLFLVSRGLLRRPNFYLSEYVERHRDAYYDGLLGVSRDQDWESWVRFFLGAVEKQAAANIVRIEAMMGLYETRRKWIVRATRSPYAVPALDALFQRPVFRSSAFLGDQGVSRPAALRLLRVMRKAGVIEELRTGNGRRSPVFSFPELMEEVERPSDFGDSS